MSFISEHRDEFAIVAMCRVLSVSQQGWRKSLRARLVDQIRRIHRKSRGSYGSPRIAMALEKENWGKCRNRVARLMAREGIRGKTNGREAPRTTGSGHGKAAAANLARLLEISTSNQLWHTDITYIRIDGSFTYLAAVLDSFTRKIVGWQMDVSLESDLVINALEKAVLQQRPGPGLVVHSDRGIQYASKSPGVSTGTSVRQGLKSSVTWRASTTLSGSTPAWED